MGVDIPDDAGRVVSTEGGRLSESSKSVSLPENVELDVPSRDLLLRLLYMQPTKRLRSLRMLQTIAFYKGFNFEDVKNKKVKPNDLLREHFPDGPPEAQDEYFDACEFTEFDDHAVLVTRL